MAVLRVAGAIRAHREAQEDQAPTGHGLFEVECDAVQSELSAHRQQSAPMETLESLALADLGKDTLHDRAAQAILSPRLGLGHYLDHPLLEFFVGVAFEGTGAFGIRALGTQ